MADPQQIIQSQTTIPDYARPYVENLLGQTAGVLYNYARDGQGNVIKDASGMPVITGFNPMQQYGEYDEAGNFISGERTARFQDLQEKAFTGAENLDQNVYSKAAASGVQSLAERAGGYGYAPSQYGNQYQSPTDYRAGTFAAQQVNAPQLRDMSMQAATVDRSGLPSIQAYQMGPAERVSTQSFAQPGSAEAFMSPYMQSVVERQQREAERTSNIQRTQNQAQAVKSGAFGGSRQAIVEAERQRNLATQMGDIQASGLQGAYQQAQQQFNAEQQARLAAQQYNQQAGLTTGTQNLSAMLQTQGLGANQALSVAQANQQAQQQANLQNLSAGLQTQGLQAQTGLQAQQANQQYGLQAQQLGEQSRQFGYGQDMTSAAQAAQYGQAANQLNEQSRQYGAGLGLQGLQTGMTGYNSLGGLGNQLFNQQVGAAGLQQQFGTQQQQQVQNVLNTQYQDFINEQNYPYKQLSYMSDMLRGVPLTQQSQSIYQAPPSALSQVAGLGTAAYGAVKASGSKKGGRIPGAGLADLAIEKIGQEY